MMTPVNIMDTGKLLFLGILAARLQIMKHPPWNAPSKQKISFSSGLAFHRCLRKLCSSRKAQYRRGGHHDGMRKADSQIEGRGTGLLHG